MCGIAAIVGDGWTRSQLASMVASQHHRGPDGQGLFIEPGRVAGLGHNRLSIIDVSSAGSQPMTSRDGALTLSFNGEIYNYRELRRELAAYPFKSATDTEVILAAYERWGDECLDHFIGMFAFCLWDARRRRLFCARDRFGVKPLHYEQRDGRLLIASEIKALQAAVGGYEPDARTWATYLDRGISDHSSATFWRGIEVLPPGHALAWQDGHIRTWCWYDLADRIDQARDPGSIESARDEYFALMVESVRLRFRADVPVGIALSGGLDSSTLLGLVQEVQGAESSVQAFTYVTGEPEYDELLWVGDMLAQTRHRSVVCRLNASDIPELALSVQAHEDEPFGGLPTLGYARLFEEARKAGVIVLLDGQGLDEQWAGYDYYRLALAGQSASTVQGTATSPVRPECLIPEFRRLSEPPPYDDRHFDDPLRKAQCRDIRYTKIPRALRFNDRASMRSSTELREPFLDHRLFELALIQPAERKIRGETGKWLLRQMAAQLLPTRIVEAPKRAVSTPQREWLRGPLRAWATECIERALEAYAGVWLDAVAVRSAWVRYCNLGGDNSFFVWQWINLGLMVEVSGRPSPPPRETIPA